MFWNTLKIAEEICFEMFAPMYQSELQHVPEDWNTEGNLLYVLSSCFVKLLNSVNWLSLETRDPGSHVR